MKSQDLKIVEEEGVSYLDVGGHLLDYADLFDLISRMSYKVKEHGLQNLLTLIDVAKLLIPTNKNVPYLEQAVRELVLRNFQSSLDSEFDIQDLAKEKIVHLIEGSKVIDKTPDSKHMPDIWLEIEGKEIPVEVKLNKFDAKAKEQLARYVNFYESSKGVAVGRELTTELPNNMMFISIKELRDTNE